MEEPEIGPKLHASTPPSAPGEGARIHSKTILFQHFRAHHVEEPEISQNLQSSNTSERTRWRSQNSAHNYTFPTPPSAPGGGTIIQSKTSFFNTSERTMWRSQKSAQNYMFPTLPSAPGGGARNQLLDFTFQISLESSPVIFVQRKCHGGAPQ